MVDPTKLPIELVHKIINYTNVVTFRNGRYINRLKKDDYRYEILKAIVKPIIVPLEDDSVVIEVIKNNKTHFSMYYVFKNNKKYVSIFSMRNKILNKDVYINNINNKWSKIVEYYM